MAIFDKEITRKNVPVTPEVSNEIIQELPHASVVLERARRVRMAKGKYEQPVLATLPEAQWISPTEPHKQTTDAAWENLTLTAAELAVLVPIADDLLDDSDINIWAEIKPRLVEAFAKKIDQAAIFGIEKPTAWPEAIVPAAIKAGNKVARGKADLGVDVAEVAKKVAQGGFSVNGFAAQPGVNWELIGTRDTNGQPIYHPAIAQGQPNTLYGYPLNEVTSGAWDATQATLLAADWDKFVVGVRQDMTFKLSTDATIRDASGQIGTSAFQDDKTILRAVMRIGFAVANPVTGMQSDAAKRYPAGVVTPATSGSRTA